MKWGLLGGAFDPVHFGHLRSGEEVLEMMGLEKVLFIPSFMPPFKRHLRVTPFEHRLNMARLAAGPNPRFEVSDIERRHGISYSIDTVRLLKEKHGTALDLYFIVGRDAFRDIHGWKDWRNLLASCNFVITIRPGSDCGGERAFLDNALPEDYASLLDYDPATDSFIAPSGHSLAFRKISLLDISSTDLRERLRKGLSIRYLVPDEVIRYIEENGIYI